MPGYAACFFTKVPKGSRLRVTIEPRPGPRTSYAFTGSKKVGGEPHSNIHPAEFEDGEVEFLLGAAEFYLIRLNMRRVKDDKKLHRVRITATLQDAAGNPGESCTQVLELAADAVSAYEKIETEVI